MFRYLLMLAAVTIGVSLMVIMGTTWFPAAFAKDFALSFSVYFFSLTALFHYGLLRASAGKPAVFIRYYMGATTLKLFIHLGVLMVFAFLHKTEVLRFTLTFLTYYLFFTAFEVATAFRKSSSGK